MIFWTQTIVFLLLYLGVFVTSVVALVDAARRPTGAFPCRRQADQGVLDAGPRARHRRGVRGDPGPWGSASCSFLALGSAVAAIVYWVDVRPALGSGPRRRGPSQHRRRGDVRAVVQRVTRAAVRVDGEVVGSIDEPGLLVLLGVTHDDGHVQVERIARKIAELRILRDERSAVDVGAPVLVVSQFTLYADTRKGRRPTWNAAAPGPVAEPLVDAGGRRAAGRGLRVATGVFGADMAVDLVNDGPVTHPARGLTRGCALTRAGARCSGGARRGPG